MTDVLDAAKDLEMHQRQQALAAQQQRAQEPPQDIDDDGTVYCIDCMNIVSPERLAAKPDAARCIHCQHSHEVTQVPF